MKPEIKSYLPVVVSIIISLAITSCSKTPDVRLTMCQDLMVLFLNPTGSIEWQKHEPIMRGYNDLEMQVSYSTVASNGKVEEASCFYAYIQNEDAMGSEEFNTPTVAYSTNPNKMIINGKTVKKMILANAVNEVMLKQGGKAIAKVKETMKEGVGVIYEEVEKQLDK